MATALAAPLAIFRACKAEQNALIRPLQSARAVERADRTFWLGALAGHEVISATSRADDSAHGDFQ